MEKTEVIGKLERHRLVAVVRSKSAGEALATARAAADAGVRFVEITFTVPGALSVLQELAQRQELYAGAGTVLSSAAAKEAIACGARFIVSPIVELGLIRVCREAQVPCVLGAATPTEMITAARAGADLVKIFPADLLGGPDFVRQVRGPFPDLPLLISGGVSVENIKEYIKLGVTGLALSSAFLARLYAEGGDNEVQSQVRRFVKLVEEALNG